MGGGTRVAAVVLGTAVVAVALALRFLVERDRDVDATGYVRTCARWGLNVGLSPFATTYLRNEDLAAVCGRDTTFDAATQLCVPREPRVCDVDLSTPQWATYPEMLRAGACQQRGCSFDPERNRCDTQRECTNAVTEDWCDANPNCAWHGGTVCTYRTSRPAVALRTGCGADAEVRPASALCGPGTRFHAARGTCEHEENNL